MQTTTATAELDIRLFREDVVRHNPTGEQCLVMRSWNDIEDLPIPAHLQRDPSMRPLQPGELSVMDLNSTKRGIVLEAECSLIERYFHLGDAVKRSPVRADDNMSGIVLQHRSELLLRHVINDAPTISEYVPEEDVELATEVNVGDLVVCGNWLGHVEEMFEEIEGEKDGEPVKLHDLGSRFRLGKPSELARASRPETTLPDLVLAVTPLVLCVAWFAINQALPPAEAAASQRPPKFWHGAECAKLVFLRRSADCIPHVLDRVRFRTEELARRHGAPQTRHLRSPGNGEPIIVKAMVVAATRTRVKVLWQDGTTEELASSDLVPHHNLDDLDCWPGDYVSWKGDRETRIAVVQSLNVNERTAQLLWYPPRPQEPVSVVSCLELDPHGKPNENYEVFGVQRGDIVFIHPVGQTNGTILPCVPKIGELESWVHDPNDQDWRNTLVQLGARIKNIPYNERPRDTIANASSGGNIRWVGEVVNLRLNGDVEVQLPNGSIEIVPVSRLTILNDFADDFAPFDEEGGSEGYEDEEMDDGYQNEPLHGLMALASLANAALGPFGSSDHTHQWGPVQYLHNLPHTHDMPPDEPEQDAWTHLDDEDDEAQVESIAMDIDADSSTPPTSTSPASRSATSTPLRNVVSPPPTLPPQLSAAVSAPHNAHASGSGEHWRPFVILPTAPKDHAFFNQAPTSQPTKAFMQRLNKEYRVLSSSLPEDIIVRAYEDRTDLLRCLIIGSQNTPYEDAPFVIDWMLPPSFPHEPPKAHFHSWTNGNGRVNPNLYEDGKVCLSILNTWEGERNESWSAARSSLLQAFVSIQGLVLVKEPYFCEPSFERMRGTAEGTLNSRLYNERAYVMARGFVKYGLDDPPAGLQDEIQWFYLTSGRLGKVISDADTLISLSRLAQTDDSSMGRNSSEADGGRGATTDERAVPRLTLGGILPLERTISHLRDVYDREQL